METPNEKAITKSESTLLDNTNSEIQELEGMLQIETSKRQIYTRFIKDNMVEGTDYGTIKMGGFKTKPTLFKPGSEKMISLLHLTARFIKDSDTWEMLGSKPGVIAYICELTDRKGQVVGEGRGVATMQEERATPNKIVKIAEKRAQMDAILRTGGLSDVFTQDLDDPSQRGAAMDHQEKVEVARPKLATPVQIKNILKIIGDRGKTIDPLLKYYKISKIEEMTFMSACDALNKLEKTEKREKMSEDVDPNTIPDDL